MHNYATRLMSERDHLTEMATELAERAAGEQRDLTDAETETLRGWSERNATIDAELTRTRDQMASTRAWATLRHDLGSLDHDPPGGDAGAGGNGNGRRGGPPAPPSWGGTFVESEQFRDWHGGRGAPVSMPTGLLELRSAVSTAAMRAASDPITTAMLPDNAVTYEPREPTWTNPLLDVVSREPVGSGAVEWIRWQPPVPAPASEVAEGAIKPPLDLNPEEKSVTLKTYAAWKAITRQALEDWPRIRAIIEGYLRQSLLRALQAAVAAAIIADPDIPSVGTPGDPGNPGADPPVPGTPGTPLLAAIRAGMAQVEVNGFIANAVVVNPSDWAGLDIVARLLPSASIGVNRGFWGLTVVSDPSVPSGTAYVGDMAAAVTLFDRNVTNVFLTDSHDANFLKNILVILAETRAYAAVTNPGAMCKAVGNPAGCLECSDGTVTTVSLDTFLTAPETVTTTTTTETTTTSSGPVAPADVPGAEGPPPSGRRR